MEINSSCLHIGLVRNCIPLIEKKSGARICCPVNGSLVLVRGSLEATYFASEIITVGRYFLNYIHRSSGESLGFSRA
jgi:hypothetical protein